MRKYILSSTDILEKMEGGVFVDEVTVKKLMSRGFDLSRKMTVKYDPIKNTHTVIQEMDDGG